MPFTPKQNHLFRAIEHGWTPPAKSGISISKKDATKMAHEGVKDEASESNEGDRAKGGPSHERSESSAKEAREKKRLAQRKALAGGRR